jgi:hypothetical protein
MLAQSLTEDNPYVLGDSLIAQEKPFSHQAYENRQGDRPRQGLRGDNWICASQLVVNSTHHVYIRRVVASTVTTCQVREVENGK